MTIQYQTHVAPLTTQTPYETTVGWQAQHPQPHQSRPKAGIVTALTVAACVLPATFAQGSANAPTDWRPTYPDRVIRKTVPAAHQQAYFSNIQQEIIHSKGGKVVSLGSVRLWQYQWIAEPLNIPTPPPLEWTSPTTFADRVNPRPGAHASRVPAFTMDRFEAPAAATAPELPWIAASPASPPAWVHPSRVPFLASDLDRSLGTPTEFNLRFRPTLVDRHHYPWAVAPYVPGHPHFAVIVPVPVMSWTGCYLDPPPLPRKASPALRGGLFGPADVTTTVTPPGDAWPAKYPDVARARPRSLAALESKAVAPLYLADVTVTAPASSWQGSYPARVPPSVSIRVAAQQAWAMDRFAAPNEVIAPDLAAPVYADRVPAKPRPTWSTTFAAPDQVPDVTQPVRPLSWAPSYPDRYLWSVPSPEFAAFTTDTTTPHGVFNVSWVKFNTYSGPWDREPK